MKMTSNQLSGDILMDYEIELADLEGIYADMTGDFPTEYAEDFWQCPRVRELETLINLWWFIDKKIGG